jgi:hypothetical protein
MTGCPKKFVNGFRKRFGLRLRELNSGADALRQAWRILGVSVLAIIVIAMASAPAFALACAHAGGLVGHSSTCHRHGPVDRQPANHVCCAAGHDVAIPVSAFSGLQLSSLHLCRSYEIVEALDASGRFVQFTQSPGPPAAAFLFRPLRI